MNITIDNETQQAVSPAENKQISALMGDILGQRKEDWITPAKNIQFEIDNFQRGYGLDVATGKYYTMTDWANKQLNDRLSAGLNTVCSKMVTPDERMHYTSFVNNLLKIDERNFMVRTSATSGLARAVLSSSYAPIDDDLVFGTALPIIGNSSMRMESIGGNRTDTRTFMKFVSKYAEFGFHDGKRQRDFHIGFIASNSEVGSGYAQFQAFVTDAFCKNGCIFSKLEIANAKFLHRGMELKTDVPQLMGDHVSSAKSEAALNLIRQATVTALSHDGHDRIKTLLHEANAQKIEGSAVEAVKAMGKRFNTSDEETNRLLMLSGNEAKTRFGMQAAVTQLAQEAHSYDRRIELEKAGGDILSDNKLWAAIRNLESA